MAGFRWLKDSNAADNFALYRVRLLRRFVALRSNRIYRTNENKLRKRYLLHWYTFTIHQILTNHETNGIGTGNTSPSTTIPPKPNWNAPLFGR